MRGRTGAPRRRRRSGPYPWPVTTDGELIYDADCGFCTRTAVWVAGPHDVFRLVSWQSLPDLSALGLTEDDVTSAAYWRAPDGRLWRGGDAIAKALTARGGVLGVVGGLILRTPLRRLAGPVYGWVARNRYRLPGGTSACRASGGPPA